MPAEAMVSFSLFGPGVGHQLGEILGREVVARQDHHGRLGEQADELVRRQRIEVELLVEQRNGRHADVVGQQRVAVWLGPGGLHRADRAAGAADVLHEHRLVELGPQPFSQGARQEIAGAARCVGRDQGDGMAGIDVLGRRRERGQDSEKQSRDAAHRFPPSSCWARCWAKPAVFTSAAKGVSLPDEARPTGP
jgi:hypothetical protein